MKNESRVEELLAESLRSQDRQAELLAKHSKISESQSRILISNSDKLDNVVVAVKDMSKAVHQLTDVVETMISKYDKIDDHEKGIRSIERKLDTK